MGKEVPAEPMFFGIELEDYVPLSWSTSQAMAATVAALKRAVGSELYHSPGDKPTEVSGERERPTFVMPLWAFDQFIETPEGETPPDLTDPNLDNLGMKRTQNRAEFVKRMSNFQFKAGTTYTFCFWGVSQWLDNILWRLQGIVPGGLNFNKFCGKPPVHIVLYTLKPRMPAVSPEKEDTRHLDSYKNYYFHLAFWSSQAMPSSGRKAELLQGSVDQNQTMAGEEAMLRKRKKWYENHFH